MLTIEQIKFCEGELRIMNKFQGILFDSSYENIDINIIDVNLA